MMLLRHGLSSCMCNTRSRMLQGLPSTMCLHLNPVCNVPCRFSYGMYRRARALAHIPGPRPQNWLLGYMELAYTQQPHRLCTALAEKYGPIFKFRMLCFHVRSCIPKYNLQAAKPGMLPLTYEACIPSHGKKRRPASGRCQVPVSGQSVSGSLYTSSCLSWSLSCHWAPAWRVCMLPRKPLRSNFLLARVGE